MNLGGTITVGADGLSEERAAVVKDTYASDWVGDSRIVADPEELTTLNAIRHGTVWAAVNVIAGDIAQVPFNVMHSTKAGWVREERHPVHRLLNYQPNGWQTPSTFKKWVMSTSLIWGNALVYIQRDARRNVSALVPIPPQYATYDTDLETGLPYYRVTSPLVRLPPTLETYEVLHFRGLTSDGFWGYRLTEIAADEMSFGRSVVKHAANVFRNGAVPGGVLEHPGKLNVEARRHMREEWERLHRGPANTGRTAVLWEGMGYKPLTVSNVDAQLIEAMADDAVLTARLFRLPPYKLADYRQSSVRANLVQSQTDYWQSTLSDHATMMREEMSLKLFANPETYSVAPDPTELVKGDTRAQIEVAQLAVASMIWSRNEARQYVGKNPVPGGDKFENPNTTAPVKPASALAAQCRVAVKTEHDKLTSSAKTSRNFVAYVDKFYASAWPSIVCDVLGVEGGAAIAERYAAEQKKRVLGIADIAKSGQELATLLGVRSLEADATYLHSLALESSCNG